MLGAFGAAFAGISGRGSATDGASNLLADLVKNEPSLRQDRADRVEIMDHALVTDVVDRNPRDEQLAGIGIALVPHRVKFGGMDNGLGSPVNFVARNGEILGSARSAGCEAVVHGNKPAAGRLRQRRGDAVMRLGISAPVLKAA